MWPTFLNWFQVCDVKTLHYQLGLLDFFRGPGVQLRLLMFKIYLLG